MGDVELQQAQQILDAQPFSRFLGARLTRWDTSGVTLELDVRPEFLQQHGFVHGGVQAYLADNALTFAGGQVLGGNVLTADVAVNYLRPAQGDTLITRATVQAQASAKAVTLVEIFARSDGEEYLCSVGTGTIAAIKHK
ncbi:PaaI family thioesterase [Leucobacter albus]|uniref:Medium/long-chain acyl-CoA thioesterase YigI n=1 Tax=Leucobacter albus TaxID=272210 RepID=A0ABW3TQY7_9MICO